MARSVAKKLNLNLQLEDNETDSENQKMGALSAIEQITHRWDSFVLQVERGLQDTITSTPLRTINSGKHHLLSDWHLLSGTPWTSDEPTLTRLLAHTLGTKSPPRFRARFFCNLFSKFNIIRDLELDKATIIKQLEVEPDRLNVRAELTGGDSESSHEKKRRADIFISLTLEKNNNPIHINILIEAKVEAPQNDRQLLELATQYVKRGDLCLFLSRIEQPALPPSWTSWQWEDVVASLEETLAEPCDGNESFRIWITFAAATFWAGTLQVPITQKNTLISLFANPRFLKVLALLKENHVNE